MTYKSESEMVLEIIKNVRVHGLGKWDGCVCCNFSIRGVNVDINCGKGATRGIWIYSNHMDYMEGYVDGDHDTLLKPIAEEIKRQVDAGSMRGPFEYHFCEFGKDAKK